MDKIIVEVAYATPEKQVIRSLEVEVGTSLEQAVELSGIVTDFPELALTGKNAGVFSHLKPLGYVLQSGDRVEIYRPLQIDPKTARRLKAEKAELKKKLNK